MRAVVLSLIFLLPASGQFTGLATTDDGSRLWFASVLRLRGTDELPSSKIFRFSGSSFQLFAQSQGVSSVPPPAGNSPAAPGLAFPSVSGDGNIVSYAGEGHTTVLFSDGRPAIIVPDLGQLSRNGRFALSLSKGGFFSDTGVFRVDLVTGAITSLPFAVFIADAQAITSDGRVVFDSDLQGTVMLWSESAPPLVFSGLISLDSSPPIVSDDGVWIFAQDTAGLVSINVATGVRTMLVPAAEPQGAVALPAGFSSSRDGSVVLALAPSIADPPQAVIVHPDGTGLRRLTSEKQGISTAVISGDGKVAYAVTRDGELLQIDVATGDTRRLARQSVVTLVQGAPVPGSLNTVQGAGLGVVRRTGTAVQRGRGLRPRTESPDGRLTLNGTPVPVLSVTPFEVSYQIPWNTPPGNALLEVQADRIFEQTTPLAIQSVKPTAFGGVIRQDFGGSVDPSNPARPGDIVHFYLTGLGAVTPPVADGQPSPASPLSTLISPVVVFYGAAPDAQAVEVLYQGLAPGLVGIYQLTVRVPSQVLRNPFLPNGGPVSVSLTIKDGTGAETNLPPIWAVPNAG
ncbi:MAG: hypothetical protein LAP87_25555 [Acidobacteriia bacterium]|nr:hypothetical protein [Terriglobia bacterium]